ncbi:hypothetical protein K438DRAFT_2015337 [Mycena galopus ATCC 62051]|nr:hypothetical protein K438DRAFT_2015337 [Mycena galopus ATCC 62051]
MSEGHSSASHRPRADAPLQQVGSESLRLDPARCAVPDTLSAPMRPVLQHAPNLRAAQAPNFERAGPTRTGLRHDGRPVAPTIPSGSYYLLSNIAPPPCPPSAQPHIEKALYWISVVIITGNGLKCASLWYAGLIMGANAPWLLSQTNKTTMEAMEVFLVLVFRRVINPAFFVGEENGVNKTQPTPGLVGMQGLF